MADLKDAYGILKANPVTKQALEMIFDFYKKKYTNTLMESDNETALKRAQGAMILMRAIEHELS